jgi:hypothetical protein
MKLFSTIAIAATLMAFASSCQEKQHCECTVVIYTRGGDTTIHVNSTAFTDTKDKGHDYCNGEFESSLHAIYGTTAVDCDAVQD